MSRSDGGFSKPEQTWQDGVSAPAAPFSAPRGRRTKRLLVIAALGIAAIAGATTASHAASKQSCVAATVGTRTPFVRVIDPDGNVANTTIYRVDRLARDDNPYNDLYVLAACVR